MTPKFLYVLCTLIALTLTPARAQDLKLYFLDVGQGDAILVVTPDGKSMVYDAGRSRDRAAQLVRNLGVTRLDLAVLSQGDADHIGGFEGIAAQLKPVRVLTNPLAASTQTYARVIEAFRLAGTQGLKAEERTINLGSSVTLRVMPAPPGVPMGDQNANSVGILIQFGAFKAFFGGDAESTTMRGWATKYASILKDLDVYKAAHHGSKRNDTREFLGLLRPQDVGIGVGANNSYGHPQPEALALYSGVGASIWRTDLHGTVTVTVKPDGAYTVQTQKLNLRANRRARAAAMVAVALPATAPSLVGSVTQLGTTYYIYDAALIPQIPSQMLPNLVVTVRVPSGTWFIYDGPAPNGSSTPIPVSPAPGNQVGVLALSDGSCPLTHPVKGNDGSSGKVYHVPGGVSYGVTRAEVCFATVRDAEAAGYRPSSR